MIVQSAVILTDRVSRQNSRLPLSTWVQSFETPVEEGGGVGLEPGRPINGAMTAAARSDGASRAAVTTFSVSI